LSADGAAARATDNPVGAQDRAAGVLDDPSTEVNPATSTSTSTSLEPSVRTPPEVARDGYPEPLTGQVLAGGKVKAKTPDRTAPAAVRSTALATAARAASGRAR
jgi:hypothetical protein